MSETLDDFDLLHVSAEELEGTEDACSNILDHETEKQLLR